MVLFEDPDIILHSRSRQIDSDSDIHEVRGSSDDDVPPTSEISPMKKIHESSMKRSQRIKALER